MCTHPEKKFMQQAIDDVRAHIKENAGGPFGACIVKDNQVVAVAHNSVLAEHDATCHAEVNAIRAASKVLGSHELTDCVIYSTTEPCPMCFSAIHWAKIERIIFGTRIADVAALGFNELSLPNELMQKKGGSPVHLQGDFMRDACLELLRDWQSDSAGKTY